MGTGSHRRVRALLCAWGGGGNVQTYDDMHDVPLRIRTEVLPTTTYSILIVLYFVVFDMVVNDEC